jgi:hypothetical protein
LDKQIRVPLAASSLVRPTYDIEDILWVGGQTGGAARIWVVDARRDAEDALHNRPTEVAAPWLSKRLIVALRVAPDGQRVAVVSTDKRGNGPRVEVAGVMRGTNGLPERLAAPLQVAPALTLVRDLVWVDQTRMATLGRKSNTSPVRVWIVEIGGRTLAAESSDVPTARAITTVNGERGLVVTTEDDRIFLRAGSSWLEVADGTDFAVPAT